jgi:SAM-dependent methyltransferase
MIEAAKRLNADTPNGVFHLNKSPNLALFDDESFDFIYTAHVLQHMEPSLQRFYIEEFVRTLRPGGLAAFEMVTERRVGATAPLPADAYNTELALLEPLPDVLAPGQRLALSVRVANRGAHPLPATGKDGWYQVTVANHWLDGDGQRVVNDDGRAELPGDIEPGADVSVVLDVVAPAEAGSYQLELDCVQEGVAWFADRGSATSRYSCRVQAPRRGLFDRFSARGAAQPAAPRGHDVETAAMEMHGVAEDEVRSWVEAAGGAIVASTSFSDLLDVDSPDWHRKIYLVTREPNGAA